MNMVLARCVCLTTAIRHASVQIAITVIIPVSSPHVFTNHSYLQQMPVLIMDPSVQAADISLTILSLQLMCILLVTIVPIAQRPPAVTEFSRLKLAVLVLHDTRLTGKEQETQLSIHVHNLNQ
jgi:hypothetical protein